LVDGKWMWESKLVKGEERPSIPDGSFLGPPLVATSSNSSSTPPSLSYLIAACTIIRVTQRLQRLLCRQRSVHSSSSTPCLRPHQSAYHAYHPSTSPQPATITCYRGRSISPPTNIYLGERWCGDSVGEVTATACRRPAGQWSMAEEAHHPLH